MKTRLSLTKHPANLRDLFRIYRNSVRITFPTASGWTETVTGSGTTSQLPSAMYVSSGNTNSSEAKLHVVLQGLSRGTQGNSIDWDKMLLCTFTMRYEGNTSALHTRYFQLKTVNTHGDLAATGLGIKVMGAAGLTLYGESYGSARGEIQLIETITANDYMSVAILLNPTAETIQYWVDGTLQNTQSTAANIPTGTAGCNAVLSSENGISGNNAQFKIANLNFWQEM